MLQRRRHFSRPPWNFGVRASLPFVSHLYHLSQRGGLRLRVCHDRVKEVDIVPTRWCQLRLREVEVRGPDDVVLVIVLVIVLACGRVGISLCYYAQDAMQEIDSFSRAQFWRKSAHIEIVWDMYEKYTFERSGGEQRLAPEAGQGAEL